MLEKNIFKIKLYYYNKFINRLVNYLVLLFRNDVVKLNEYDKKTDNYLREIAIKELFPKMSKYETDGDSEDESLTALKKKINTETYVKINQIKKEYSKYFEVIDNLSENYFEDDVEITNLYDIPEVRQEVKNIKIKSLKSYIKIYQKEIRKLRKNNSEKNAVKLQIKFEYFSKALAIGTPILLIGGIFKQYIISRDFSFPLSTVFTINDYISASIDTLIFAIFPTIFYIVVFYVGLLEDSRIDLIQRKKEKKDNFLIYFNYVSIFLLIIITYFKDKIEFYHYLPIAGLYLMAIILPRLFNRYLRYDFNVIILILFTLFFYLIIFSNTKSESYKIKSSNIEKHIEFEFSENIKDIKNIKYVTSGTNYYVFWDTKDSTTILIRKEIIKKITIK